MKRQMRVRPPAPPRSVQPATQRVLVVSNRLPCVLRKQAEGWRAQPGSGGLVSALEPVLAQQGGTWIGWSGTAVEEVGRERERALLRAESAKAGFDLCPVSLTRGEVDGYYSGFSNGLLWPVLHGLPERSAPGMAHLPTYRRVNERFAEEVVRRARTGDVVWVNDYQLMLAGKSIRARADSSLTLAFFLHVPFPDAETLRQHAFGTELLEALLAYDVIGFQTGEDQRNFLDALQVLLPDRLSGDRRAPPDSQVVRLPASRGRRGPGADEDGASDAQDGTTVISQETHDTRVVALPIGIDVAGFSQDACDPAVVRRAAELRASLAAPVVLLGVDRLDYTKGLLERLDGLEALLERSAARPGTFVFEQLVVPSRQEVPQYAHYRRALERRVAAINQRFGNAAWQPVHHRFESVPRQELLALYRAADVLVVASLKDGMNLVCMEYCASRSDLHGALVLSRHAGAACRLGHEGALLVDPRQPDALADALQRAIDMPREEQTRRMRRLRGAINRLDVHGWARDFLAFAGFEVAKATGHRQVV